MSKAEEKAVEYQIKTHGPNVMGGASVLSEEEYMRLNMNLDFKNGYEQAEKDLGWRSIHDSLPEDGEYVFVRSEGEYKDGTPMLIAVVRYDHKIKKWVDYNDECWSADYWMPCPKIPEE